MNILFLSTTFPDAGNPARGTYNAELCKALSESHSVRVIAPRTWSEQGRALWERKPFRQPAFAKQCGLDCHYPTFFYPPGMMRGRYGQFLTSSIRSTVSNVCKSWKPDLVLSYWVHPEGEAGAKIAKQYDAKSAVIVGGSDVLLLPKRPGCRELVVNTLQQTMHVLTVSNGLKNAVQELGIPADKVHTVYQGIDTGKFHPGNIVAARNHLELDLDRPLLLWVGRMEPVKSLDVLINAVEILKESVPDILLCIIGSGSEKARMQQLIEEKQLQNNIRLVGAIGHNELPEWYRAADVTVLSSHSEGLPNVLRESLACGTPFVSTDVGSIHEIAVPGTCELTPTGDAKAFAQAVEEVLAGPHREIAQQYQPRQWQQMADDIVKLVSSTSAHTTQETLSLVY